MHFTFLHTSGIIHIRGSETVLVTIHQVCQKVGILVVLLEDGVYAVVKFFGVDCCGAVGGSNTDRNVEWHLHNVCLGLRHQAHSPSIINHILWHWICTLSNLNESGWNTGNGSDELHIDVLEGELLVYALLIKRLRQESRGAETVIVDEGALCAWREHTCVWVRDNCRLEIKGIKRQQCITARVKNSLYSTSVWTRSDSTRAALRLIQPSNP